MRRIVINIVLAGLFLLIMTAVTLPLGAQVRADAAGRLRRAGYWDEARAAYEDALALAPLSSGHWNEYGDFLWDMAAARGSRELFDRIEPVYRRASELDPLGAEPRIKLGHLAIAEGRIDEALGFFRQARALDPNGRDTAFYLREAGFHLLERNAGFYEVFLELAGEFAESTQGKARAARILGGAGEGRQ